jgi:hypothetical protein
MSRRGTPPPIPVPLTADVEAAGGTSDPSKPLLHRSGDSASSMYGSSNSLFSEGPMQRTKSRGLFGLRNWRARAPKITRQHQRLIDRNSSYFQSFGRLNIQRLGREGVQQLYANDRFHTVVNMATYKVLVFLFLCYLLVVTVFASIYLLIALLDGCNLGIVDFREAYYFSLETMTTVRAAALLLKLFHMLEETLQTSTIHLLLA